MRIIKFEDALDVGSIAVRLAPIDAGFDLRGEGTTAQVPRDTTRASYAVDGERMVVEGTIDDVARALENAGYSIAVVDP